MEHKRNPRVRERVTDADRVRNAADAVAGFLASDAEAEILMTGGTFSIIQIVQRLALAMGGEFCEVLGSFSKAGYADVEYLAGITGAVRFVLDRSGIAVAARETVAIVEACGIEQVRFTNNNARFLVCRGAAGAFVITTSANFNHNRRFEIFTLYRGDRVAEGMAAHFEEIWKTGADIRTAKADAFRKYYRKERDTARRVAQKAQEERAAKAARFVISLAK